MRIVYLVVALYLSAFSTVAFSVDANEKNDMVSEANNNSIVFVGHPDIFEDGDSFWIGIHKVRLHGIDAPEPKQLCGEIECGQRALQFLKDLSKNNIFKCKAHLAKYGKPWMMYGRYVVTCKAGDTIINEEMVRSGWALASDKSYGQQYQDEQIIAKKLKAGMHSTRYLKPKDWRKSMRNERCSHDNIASAIPPSIDRILSDPGNKAQ